MRKRKLKHIIWAIDPFAPDPAVERTTAQFLKALVADSNARIEPVYVISAFPVGRPPASGFDFLGDANKLLSQKLKKLKLPTLLPHRIVTQEEFSLKKAVKTLTKYAEKKGVDLIVASTHGKKGISRAFLGSFAETLSFQTRVPVCMINPKSKRITQIKQILFPTDLSPASYHVFKKIVLIAERLKAKLTIYHQVDTFVNHVGYLPPPRKQYLEALRDDIKNRTKEIKRMVSYAKENNVTAIGELGEHKTDTVRAILQFATKKHVSMIAMASQTGPVSSAILGSVTRGVSRGARCPVWIVHPDRKKTKTNRKKLDVNVPLLTQQFAIFS